MEPKNLELNTPFLGNLDCESPKKVIIRITEELLLSIKKAIQILEENTLFTKIKVDCYATSLDKNDEEMDGFGRYSVICVMRNRLHYQDSHKHDDSATVESDDFSESFDDLFRDYEETKNGLL